MGHWTKHTLPIAYENRMGPVAMEAKYGPGFIDVNGDPQSTADWNYLDPNGKALHSAGVPLKYWTPDGAGSVREMTQPEKDAVDAQELLDRENESRDIALAVFNTPADEVEPLGLEQRSDVRERNQDYNDLIQRIHYLERVVAELLASSGNNWNAARSAAQTEADAMTQDPRSWPAIAAGGLAQNAAADRWFPSRLDRTVTPFVELNPSVARTPEDAKALLRKRITDMSEKNP